MSISAVTLTLESSSLPSIERSHHNLSICWLLQLYVVGKVAEKSHISTFGIFPCLLWPWPWGQGHLHLSDLKGHVTNYFKVNFHTFFSWKVAEKSYILTFLAISHVACDLGLWVKVIFIYTLWKILWHTTNWPSFITVVLIVSEKLPIILLFSQMSCQLRFSLSCQLR